MQRIVLHRASAEPVHGQLRTGEGARHSLALPVRWQAKAGGLRDGIAHRDANVRPLRHPNERSGDHGAVTLFGKGKDCDRVGRVVGRSPCHAPSLQAQIERPLAKHTRRYALVIGHDERFVPLQCSSRRRPVVGGAS